MTYIDSHGNDWKPVFDTFTNPKPGQTFELGYVDYRDDLPDDYVSAELSGHYETMDEMYEVFSDAVLEVESEALTFHTEWELEKHGIDPEEAEQDDWHMLDDLRAALQESPGAVTYLDQLRDRATPRLMRVQLLDGEQLQDGFDDAYHDYDAKHEALTQRFIELGLDVDSKVNKEALFDIVYNGMEFWHEGVSLDVIWHGHYQLVTPGRNEKHVTFVDPHLVLIDPWHGSGFDAQVEGNITVTIDPAGENELPHNRRAFLDSDAGGYGWDEIAGVVHSYYDINVGSSEPTGVAA